MKYQVTLGHNRRLIINHQHPQHCLFIANSQHNLTLLCFGPRGKESTEVQIKQKKKQEKKEETLTRK